MSSLQEVAPRGGVRPRSDHARVGSDFYVESRWTSRAIFKVERFPEPVLDPACGTGQIVEAAFAASIEHAYGSDIERRTELRSRCAFLADFLDAEAWTPGLPLDLGRRVGSIVTNPPYALSERFAKRALDVARFKVAMLLPLAWLEGDKRSRWLEKTPLARVWVSRSRVGLRPGGEALKTDGGTKAFAWFVWDHDHAGPPQIRWFDKPKAA